MDPAVRTASANQPASSTNEPLHAEIYSNGPAPACGSPMPSSASAKPPRRTAPGQPGENESQKRRCISTACVACRKRKSKCDGALPSCAACASVYGTECLYKPNSDHRRKGVYREKLDSTKVQGSTLQIIVDAILNASEDDVAEVVNRVRTCNSLDAVAQSFLAQGHDRDSGFPDDDQDQPGSLGMSFLPVEGERDLAGKMGELRLENGSLRFIGGTSHLIFLKDPNAKAKFDSCLDPVQSGENPAITWTRVTSDPYLIIYILNAYFNYHYQFFATLVPKLFWRDFMKGRAGQNSDISYCSPLLVNVMLAVGCHFTDILGAYGTAGDSKTKGDHFFAEAKRLMVENAEYERPCLTTVQALALMSVREAGCARETQGWVYSGMSFRMALDLGLNLEVAQGEDQCMTEEETDARRITFWGCFLFDKCWSNYLGRLPQLPRNCFNVARLDVFPDEDAAPWSPFTAKGFDETLSQPSRTRAIALQLSRLCEITSDLLLFFYHPSYIKRSGSKSLELKKLSELHQRLEEWRRDLPKELEAREGSLPNVILMHAFFHLQYIHLFRPFLKYHPSSSPLPSHISPRRICTANAGAISKLMRLYAKSWRLRQICNIAVYMLHSACTVHLLNLPEKTAKRDVIHGLKHLEEMAEDWPCARRTLSILSVLARKWHCELPDEAALALERIDEKYGSYSTSELPSPGVSHFTASPDPSPGTTTSDPGVAAAPRSTKSWGAVLGSVSGLAEQPRQSVTPDHQLAARMACNIGQSAPLTMDFQDVPGSSIDQPRHGDAVETQQVAFDQTLNAFGQWEVARHLSVPLSSAECSSIGPSGAGAENSIGPAVNMGQIGAKYASFGSGVSVVNGQWILSESERLHQTFESWQERDGNIFMLGPAGREREAGDGSRDDSTTLPPTPPALGNSDANGFPTLGECSQCLSDGRGLPGVIE